MGKAADRSVTLDLDGVVQQLFFRNDSSDRFVIHEVFYRRGYALVESLRDVSLIVDCGAYIGATTVFLCDRFPQARVVAIEPDADNFAVLRTNTAPFSDRVTLVRAALWPEDGALVIERGSFRDGLDWSYQVRRPQRGEPAEVEAVSPATLLARLGEPTVDLLKIDIERAELELFGAGEVDWMDSVRNLVIELHDDECVEAFQRAMRPFAYETVSAGELLLCAGIRRRAAH